MMPRRTPCSPWHPGHRDPADTAVLTWALYLSVTGRKGIHGGSQAVLSAPSRLSSYGAEQEGAAPVMEKPWGSPGSNEPPCRAP